MVYVGAQAALAEASGEMSLRCLVGMIWSICNDASRRIKGPKINTPWARGTPFPV